MYRKMINRTSFDLLYSPKIYGMFSEAYIVKKLTRPSTSLGFDGSGGGVCTIGTVAVVGIARPRSRIAGCIPS